MKSIVIGTDGLVGRALKEDLSGCGEFVFGTTRRPNQTENCIAYLDLFAPESFCDFPDADVAFICGAMTRLADCRNRPNGAERINSHAPAILAGKFAARGMRTIFLSTCAVFDCREPLMKADRPRAGTSVYGRTKAAAEDLILASSSTAAIVRLTKVLGPDIPLLKHWANELTNGRQVYAASDHRIAPVSLDHVVKLLVLIAATKATGCFQISAAEDVSYLQMGRRLAHHLHVDVRNVVGRPAAEFDLPVEEIFPFTSLDTGALETMSEIPTPNAFVAIDHAIRQIVSGLAT